MTKIRTEFIEFSVYDEILNGRLKPYLVESISDHEFRSILDELSAGNIAERIQNVSDEYFRDERYEIPNSYNLYDSEVRQDIVTICADPVPNYLVVPGPEEKIESKQQQGGRVDNQIQNEIELDQNPLLSLKVWQLKAIIQNEFEGIKQRALDFITFSGSEDELRSVANRNIEKAKKLAADASELRDQLSRGASNGGELNAHIVDMVRYFLVHSIIFYQHHFGPYIDRELISNDELEAIFNRGKACWPILKRLEGVQISGKNERAKTSSPYIVPIDVNGNHFVLKGDFWELSYCGNETNIKNCKRTRYIVRLLESPNEDFYCHELASLVNGDDPDNYLAKLAEIDPIESDDQTDTGQGNINFVNPIEDEISREDFEACINVADGLWKKANAPNMPEEKREKAKKDWRKAQYHFGHEYGLVFYESKSGDLRPKIMKRLKKDFEKFRTNVQKQVSKAIADIAQKNPSFSAYLKNHIRTGIRCSFRPDPEDKRWTIDWGK